MDLDKTREKVPSFRYADCCAYCKFGGSDNVCEKYNILINLMDEPTICDSFEEYGVPSEYTETM